MKETKCEHENIVPQAYFTTNAMPGPPTIHYLVVMCVDCDEYWIEEGTAMQKEED